MAVNEPQIRKEVESQEFGGFILLEHLGTGGIGSVYRARQQDSERIVAIKTFTPDDEHPPDLMRALKEREVRMLVSVQHPNVVAFYDDGQVGEHYYYAMEYVGDDLLNEMRSGQKMDTLDKMRILRQTTNALQAIHNQGIVHRDIKPGNILLDRDANGALHVKVTDLGIARLVTEADIVREKGKKKIPGTPKYLSPEQIELRAVDGRSDIFSLGVVAYQLLTGSPPFQPDEEGGYLKTNREQEPDPIDTEELDLPDFASDLVSKMLAKAREDRYDSHTLARDLELVEQHLVSGAPLVEQSNRESLFYVPDEDEEETKKVSILSRILPVSRVLAGVWLALGLFAAIYLYMAIQPPSPEEPTERSAATGPIASASGLLKAASRNLGEGRVWGALAYLRRIEREELGSEERIKFEDVRESVREQLAPRMYEAGKSMLAAGRLAEAEALLQRMEELFPGAAQLGELQKELEQSRRIEAQEEKWFQSYARATDLVEAERYREALEELKQVMQDAGGAAEKVSATRRTVAEALRRWSNELRDGWATPSRIRACLRELEPYRALDVPGFYPRAYAEALHFKLAESYEEQSEYEEAADVYRQIIESFPGQTADRAREAKMRVEMRLLRRPLSMDQFSRELQREGFKSSLWQSRGNAQVRPGADGQTLLLRGGRSTGQHTSSLFTRRALRSSGFHIGVDFTVRGSPSNPSRWKAGLEVKDPRGRSMSVYFDGSQYTAFRSYVLGRRLVSGGVPLEDSYGDEQQSWHTLAVSQEPRSGKASILLDGEEVRRLSVNLQEFKVRLFLETRGKSDFTVQFRNLVCRQ